MFGHTAASAITPLALAEWDLMAILSQYSTRNCGFAALPDYAW